MPPSLIGALDSRFQQPHRHLGPWVEEAEALSEPRRRDQFDQIARPRDGVEFTELLPVQERMPDRAFGDDLRKSLRLLRTERPLDEPLEGSRCRTTTIGATE